MAKKHKQLAAARPHAARWKNQPLAAITACPPGAAQSPLPLPVQSTDKPEALSTTFRPLDLDLDCLSDCGYIKGISFHLSDDEYEPGSPSGSKWSNNESLCELGGDDLEENLKDFEQRLGLTSFHSQRPV